MSIGKYGLVADIKQAFFQMCLNKDYRDFVRFLWFTYIHDINPEVVFLRFARVVFGLTSTPFLLDATIKHHLEKYLHLTEFKEIIQKLILNLYVDDSTNPYNGVEDAIQFHEKSKIALADASFYLRKWTANSKKIQNFINDQFEEDKTSESTHRKVLGIIWDIHADNLIFDFTDIIELCNALEPTKRNILRIQGMLKDPLGLISPITLPIKIMLQKLFEIKFERDKYIDTNTSQLRKRYIKGLKHVSSVSVTRHMLCY